MIKTLETISSVIVFLFLISPFILVMYSETLTCAMFIYKAIKDRKKD